MRYKDRHIILVSGTQQNDSFFTQVLVWKIIHNVIDLYGVHLYAHQGYVINIYFHPSL